MNRRNFLKGSAIAISAIAISGAAGSSLNKLLGKSKKAGQSFSFEIITDKPETAVKLSQKFFAKNSLDTDLIKFSEYPADGELFGDIVFVNNGKLINYKNEADSISKDIKNIANDLDLPKKIKNPSRIKFYSTNDNARASQFLIFHKGVLKKTINAGEKKFNLNIAGTKGNVMINFENNRMRVIESSCNHKTCVNSGSISLSGESIVCIPNELLIHCE